MMNHLRKSDTMVVLSSRDFTCLKHPAVCNIVVCLRVQSFRPSTEAALNLEDRKDQETLYRPFLQYLFNLFWSHLWLNHMMEDTVYMLINKSCPRLEHLSVKQQTLTAQWRRSVVHPKLLFNALVGSHWGRQTLPGPLLFSYLSQSLPYIVVSY